MTDFTKAISHDIASTINNVNVLNPYISQYNPRNIYWPIELHILCYINERNKQSISKSNLEEIYDDILDTAALSPCGKYINKELKDPILFSLQYLVNKPKRVIQETILSEKFVSTWNNYSLSIMYLHLISFMENMYGHHNFFQRFSRLLINNIHFIAEKRESVFKTGELFEELVDSISEEGWNRLIGGGIA